MDSVVTPLARVLAKPVCIPVGKVDANKSNGTEPMVFGCHRSVTSIKEMVGEFDAVEKLLLACVDMLPAASVADPVPTIPARVIVIVRVCVPA